jgi:UDP-N-acetylmuramate dehydrogenase
MRHYSNFDLCDHNSYQLKAFCKNAFFPESEEDFHEIFISRRTIPKTILGGGYNVILSKPYYEHDFIIFHGCLNDIITQDTTIEAGCGASLLSLSETAYLNSLTGFEMFYDIPGSLGGALVMNAGANGEEMKDIVSRVRFFNIENQSFDEISNPEARFGYRSSIFQGKPHLVITRAWFDLQKGIKEEINKKMEDIKRARWASQPREHPNAGSVFRRPEGRYVGPMLDALGLKGFRIGGAMVSKKHSGFIINAGNASGYDILCLIDEIQKRVYNEFGVTLELEQKVI